MARVKVDIGELAFSQHLKAQQEYRDVKQHIARNMKEQVSQYLARGKRINRV